MKNFQYLDTELYKVNNGLSPEVIKEILVFKKMTYNLTHYSLVLLLRSGNY